MFELKGIDFLVGYWQNIEDIQEQWQINKQFEPSMPDTQRASLIKGWEKAIHATIAMTQ